MRVVAPPDHLYGDRRSVSQRPEDDTVAPVLGRGPFGSDPDAAVGGNDREPVVDVTRFEDVRLLGGRPQVRALTGLVVLGQSLEPADWLAVAAIVTANAVSVSTA
jgi:hypothetical protein